MNELHEVKILTPFLESKKTNILFVGEGVSIAHVTRAYTLSEALNKNDYEIHFATDKRFKKFIKSPTTKFYELESDIPEFFYEKIKTGKPLFDYASLKEYLEKDKDLLISSQPSIVVSDFRLSMAIACEIYGIPFVSISNGYWSPYTTMTTPLPDHPIANALGKTLAKAVMPIVFPIAFKKNIQAITKLRKDYGLKPLNHSYEAYCGMDHVLYMDLPELTPTQNLPEKHQFIGPVLWEPDCELPNWELSTSKKIVYLTLGSSGAINEVEKIVDALLLNDFQVITTCPVRERKNVYKSNLLPGLKIAKIADLFICHGGSGTVYQALSGGVPVIGVCSNLDQQMAMTTLEKKGAALSILKKNATPEKLIEMIYKIENCDRRYLNELKNKIRESDAIGIFSKIIKELRSEGRCFKNLAIHQ